MDKIDLAHDMVTLDAENKRLAKPRRERARLAAAIIRDLGIRERERGLSEEAVDAFEKWWEK